ncbi:hypothetical protein SFC07_08370 [Corynebacterium callunae]|uniref:hypothetical protein n=1 Tax=Corynebacterium callunae TaxID=1721 RepID=UPI003981A4A6
MEDLLNRFEVSKKAYQELIAQDFPKFDLEKYAAEKIREAESSETGSNFSESEKAEEDGAETKRRKFGRKIASKLDFNADSKFGFDDLAGAAKRSGQAATAAAKNAGEASKNFVEGTKEKIENANRATLAESAVLIGKSAIGVQAVQNRKAAKEIQKVCSEYYELAQEVTEEKRRRLNYAIEDFGKYRLQVLHLTVGRFLDQLKALKQNNAAKEYEILMGADFRCDKLAEMKAIDMAAGEALRSTAVAGVFGLAALTGTPTAVTTAVGAVASASTGTAISALSGAAATNATLAWLGGGSLAAGGGGVALGTTVLTAITAGSTGVVAILAAGTIASVHYSKKLTEAKDYEREVGLAVTGIEKGWLVMDGIGDRTAELREITEQLKWRVIGKLDELEKIIPEFDFHNSEHVAVFNQCGILIKTMVILAQTPILDDDQNLSFESMQIIGKVHSVLNTEV